MRSTLRLALPLTVFVVAVACGSSSGRSGFGSQDSGVSQDASTDVNYDVTSDRISLLGDTKMSGCVNLQCAQTDCAAKGMPETTLTGTVRDPGGNLPIYNVYVYVPNATPDPIEPGNPTCTPCEAPASGNPLLGTSTDTNGKFTLQKGTDDTWGVPSGTNVPLVLQIGKWRRQLVVPKIDACTTVDLDSVLGPDQMRLPSKSSEGDMPLIALTTACFDAFECFLKDVIGVDETEFVPPGSKTGHVQIYTGACNGKDTPSSSIAGGNTVEDTFTWWQSSANLLKYDFVLNGCDGVPAGSRGTGYTAIEEYLDGGGRVFATDFLVDWFSPPDGPAADSMVAGWPGWDNAASFGHYFIDTSFPKGAAFGTWLVTNSVAKMVGTAIEIDLTDTWADVNHSGPPTYPDSTRWIYNAMAAGDAAYGTSYISFNTPIGTPTAKQCGRAVFSGVHVFPPGTAMTFPNECTGGGGATKAAAINEKALEFLFFDQSSCVQDNTQPPTQPPPK